MTHQLVRSHGYWQQHQQQPFASSSPPAIEFVNVRFRYPSRPHHWVLRGLNLTVPAGKTVALMGASGSGKSTLVALVQRLYDVASDDGHGAVLVGGTDVRKLHPQQLRKHIGVVSQDPMLLQLSVLENIRLGCEHASEADVVQAAKAAHVHDAIMACSDGYRTQVSLSACGSI